MIREDFFIVVSGGIKAGVHRVTVTQSNPKVDGVFYVTGNDFGCSRDYSGTKVMAIQFLLQEHGARLVRGVRADLVETYVFQLYKMGSQRTFFSLVEFVLTDDGALKEFGDWCEANSDG